MNAKKVLTGSLLTLAATGFAVSPAAAYGGGGHQNDDGFSQEIQVIDDICLLNEVINVAILGKVDASSTQCNEAEDHSAVVGNN